MELDECPAALDVRLNGVHRGRRAGRSCWVLAGTLSGGEVQGSFAAKMASCRECDFYRKVKAEEGTGFSLTSALLPRLE